MGASPGSTDWHRFFRPSSSKDMESKTKQERVESRKNKRNNSKIDCEIQNSPRAHLKLDDIDLSAVDHITNPGSILDLEFGGEFPSDLSFSFPATGMAVATKVSPSRCKISPPSRCNTQES